jgi:hypothetical protein
VLDSCFFVELAPTSARSRSIGGSGCDLVRCRRERRLPCRAGKELRLELVAPRRTVPSIAGALRSLHDLSPGRLPGLDLRRRLYAWVDDPAPRIARGSRIEVRYPEMCIVFAESRRFAEEWTFRFLSAALSDADPPTCWERSPAAIRLSDPYRWLKRVRQTRALYVAARSCDPMGPTDRSGPCSNAGKQAIGRCPWGRSLGCMRSRSSQDLSPSDSDLIHSPVGRADTRGAPRGLISADLTGGELQRSGRSHG